MVNIARGDIVLCDLNPVVGTEQAGIRPVLVLQIDRANVVSPHTIIAPFTIRQALLPSHVLIPRGVGGLSVCSSCVCSSRFSDFQYLTFWLFGWNRLVWGP